MKKFISLCSALMLLTTFSSLTASATDTSSMCVLDGNHVDYTYTEEDLSCINFTEEVNFDKYGSISIENTCDRTLRITYRKTNRMEQLSSTVYIKDLKPQESLTVNKDDYTVIRSLCVSILSDVPDDYTTEVAAYKLKCDNIEFNRNLVVDEVTASVGDLDLNGRVNISDLLALRKYFLKEEDGYNKDIMDIDRNGNVNISDLLALRRHLTESKEISQDQITVVTIRNINKNTAV